MGTEIQVILQRAAGKGIPQIRGNSSPTIPAQGDTEGTHQLLRVESVHLFLWKWWRRETPGVLIRENTKTPHKPFFFRVTP